MYVSAARKDYRGVKQMKSKDRVTLMVATSAVGGKIPLFMVGKAKAPECFRLCQGNKPPMAYHHQANAWFDKEVTIVWINTVLWPWHLKHHGNVYCLLLLDNCPAHANLDSNRLPDHLVIRFFPPNCTSFLQPADMGMIASLKLGYKAIMLKTLLSICDDPVLYTDAIEAGRTARRGCKGLSCCAKAHLLDAMEIMVKIWDGEGKYAKTESIQRCWRKSGLLNAAEAADLENEIGSASVATKYKTISNNDCLELCNLFSQLQTTVGNMPFVPSVFHDTIAIEEKCTESELKDIISTWVDIESNTEIIMSEVDDAVALLCKETTAEESESDGDSDIIMVAGEQNNRQQKTSWAQCMACFEIISSFLSEKEFREEKVALDGLVRRLRLKRLDATTSQLSIKSFFSAK